MIRHVTTLVWLFLMLATIATTWWLSKDGFSPRVGTVAIFAIAAFKVRLVLLYFMELRTAPLPWRLIFEAWVLLATAAIVGIYLSTPPVASA
ncbi:MAG: hypothetical protein C0434_13375 [Xanthomonadaceae bacterium]|nr:hypothetical protein [Xanthomonadaceae bacterium]